MQGPVEPAPARLELGYQRGEVVRAVHVQLEHVGGLGQAGRRALGHTAGPAEAGQHDLGAGLLGALGHRVGDAALGQDARDEQALAGQHQIRTGRESAFGSCTGEHRIPPPDHLDGGAQHELAALVENPPAQLDQAVPGVELTRAGDLALDVDGVADLHRLLEDRVAHPAQRDHPLGIEVDEPGGVGEHQQPVGDPLPEAAARRPLGVGVLRMGVAGERGRSR